MKGSGRSLFCDTLPGKRKTIESLRTTGLRLRIEPEVCVFLHTAFTCDVPSQVLYKQCTYFSDAVFPINNGPHMQHMKVVVSLRVSCTIQSYEYGCLKICNLLNLCCI